MNDLRAAAKQALKALEREIDTRRCKESTLRSMNALRAALAEPTVKESLTPHPSIIDSIADNLLQDHVELMAENKRLRESLREILHEIYPPECYTDETIEYENEQGNMMMPAVKRAYALVGRDER